MPESGLIQGPFARAVAGASVGAFFGLIGGIILFQGPSEGRWRPALLTAAGGAFGLTTIAVLFGAHPLRGRLKDLAIWVPVGAVLGVVLGAAIYPHIVGDEFSRAFGVHQWAAVLGGGAIGAAAAVLACCCRWAWGRGSLASGHAGREDTRIMQRR